MGSYICYIILIFESILRAKMSFPSDPGKHSCISHLENIITTFSSPRYIRSMARPFVWWAGPGPTYIWPGPAQVALCRDPIQINLTLPKSPPFQALMKRE